MVKNPYIILQARMNSERLPGKVMKPLGGKPMIGVLLDRILDSPIPILLATSINAENDILTDYALNRGIRVFRGSENNVLERYCLAAKSVEADLIFRLTGDNPFIESSLINEIYNFYINNCNERSYISTGLSMTYPLGISIEVFSFTLLEEALKNAVLPGEFEHVTPYMHRNIPGNIEIKCYRGSQMNHYNYRLTVDTEEDFLMVRTLVEKYHCSFKSIAEIVEILDQNPILTEMNKAVKQRKWN